MSVTSLDRFFAELAEASAAVILPFFRLRQSVANKVESGFDPVTEADRAAELAIREVRIERAGAHRRLIGAAAAHHA